MTYLKRSHRKIVEKKGGNPFRPGVEKGGGLGGNLKSGAHYSTGAKTLTYRRKYTDVLASGLELSAASFFLTLPQDNRLPVPRTTGRGERPPNESAL